MFMCYSKYLIDFGKYQNVLKIPKSVSSIEESNVLQTLGNKIFFIILEFPLVNA